MNSEARERKKALFRSDFGPWRSPMGTIATYVTMPLAGWWWWSYTGPYRWLAELQLMWWSWYEVFITFAITLLLTSLALIAALRVMVELIPIERMSMDLLEMFGSGREDDALFGNVTQHAIGAVLAGAIGIVIGGMLLWQGYCSAKMQSVTAAELENGASPRSSWLEVTGVPRHDLHLDIQERYRTDVYIPLVSPGWTESQPIAVVVRVSLRGQGDQRGTASSNGGDERAFNGLELLTGLPGPVRVAWEESGLQVSNPLVLEVGERPSESRWILAWVILAGGVVLTIGAFLTLWFDRRDRGGHGSTRDDGPSPTAPWMMDKTAR